MRACSNISGCCRSNGMRSSRASRVATCLLWRCVDFRTTSPASCRDCQPLVNVWHRRSHGGGQERPGPPRSCHRTSSRTRRWPLICQATRVHGPRRSWPAGRPPPACGASLAVLNACWGCTPMPCRQQVAEVVPVMPLNAVGTPWPAEARAARLVTSSSGPPMRAVCRRAAAPVRCSQAGGRHGVVQLFEPRLGGAGDPDPARHAAAHHGARQCTHPVQIRMPDCAMVHQPTRLVQHQFDHPVHLCRDTPRRRSCHGQRVRSQMSAMHGLSARQGHHRMTWAGQCARRVLAAGPRAGPDFFRD